MIEDSETSDVVVPDELHTALVAAHKAAEETLIMGNDACNEASHPQFTVRYWETIRDAAIKEVGMPPKAEMPKIKPMEAKAAKEFGKDEMPRGKYVEEPILDVYNKDPDYLRHFAVTLDRWQVALQSWIAGADADKAKAVTKAIADAKKPKPAKKEKDDTVNKDAG